MQEQKVEIKETLSRIVTVNAENEEDAYNEAEVLWGDGDIVLDSSDFVDVDYEVI